MDDEKLEFKIGGIKGGLPQKFVVLNPIEGENYNKRKLVFYATGNYTSHRDIKEQFGVSGDVLGGGYVHGPLKENLAVVLDKSSDVYGPVPKEVLEQFRPELEEEYKRICPNMGRLIIATHDFQDHRWDHYPSDKWKWEWMKEYLTKRGRR